MRFFHLSDLHLGLKLQQKGMLEDQRHILEEIAALAGERQPDAVVIAGDIYDHADPSAEAVTLFDAFLGMLRQAAPDAAILAISGNHDSAQRLNVYRGILSREHVYMIGMPPMRADEHVAQVTLEDGFGPVHFYLLPFVKPAMVRAITKKDEDEPRLSYDEALHRLLAREAVDTSARNVLVSHQFYLPTGVTAEDAPRADTEVHAVGNIDAVRADVLAPFDYAALGHIHKAWHWAGGRACYCGAPLATSFSEADTVKYLREVTLEEKGTVRIERFELHPAHPVRILRGTLETLLAGHSEDYVRLVLTEDAQENRVDVRDRLRACYPNFLEIRREQLADRGPAVDFDETIEALTSDPFELCEAFLQGELRPEERAELADILHAVEGV